MFKKMCMLGVLLSFNVAAFADPAKSFDIFTGQATNPQSKAVIHTTAITGIDQDYLIELTLLLGTKNGSECVATENVGAMAREVSPGDELTASLDGAGLAGGVGLGYDCAEERYEAVDNDNNRRTFHVLYTLGKDQYVYTSADPSHGKVDLSQ